MAAFSRSRRIGASFASAMLLLSFATCSDAADKPGAKDFASISRFKGAEIAEYATSEFDATTLPIKPMPDNPPPAASVSKVEGKITRILYAIPAGKSPLEVMRNYEQALGGSGYKTVFACAGAECGNGFAAFVASGAVMPNGWRATFDVDKNRFLLAQRAAPGGDVYVLLYAMQETNYPATLYQETVELKPMQSGQVRVLDAAALKRGLDSDGKVAVYGVFFDTAKSDIKPESKASLDEMARLLAANASLKVYIVGHTDNAGTLAGNLELSQRRAEAVAKTLAATYKIDPQRMVARGVASLAPVSSNGDEAGRARNRRVELVVQ